MYSNILVAMALDHNVSEKTIAVAKTLLSPGGTITALHVLEDMRGTTAIAAESRDDVLKAGEARAQALFRDKLAAHPEVTPKLVRGHVARSLVDYATEIGADCIVMGSHEPGLADYLLGSTAARVVRHAPCAVHVFRSK